jgi:DNA anti-recombination protein RmuC
MKKLKSDRIADTITELDKKRRRYITTLEGAQRHLAMHQGHVDNAFEDLARNQREIDRAELFRAGALEDEALEVTP